MDSTIIVFDIETFNYDCLVGTLLVKPDGSVECKQMWDADEIRAFYEQHKDDFWVGHNNKHFDNAVLEAIIRHKNPKTVASQIIEQGKRVRCNLNFKYYDLMATSYYSLKVTEASAGKNISESQVDFTVDRPLTQEEKELTEKYNRDDLYQTLDNLSDPSVSGYLSARLNLVDMFNLPSECLTLTETQVAARVLKAKQVPGIEYQLMKPIMYSTLQLNNKELIDYYLREGFRTKEKCKFMLCGTEHKCGSGGIHAALNKYHTDKALYFDVSGYYNLVMLNYDLLPRTMGPESKEIYRDLYYKQLEYKKTAPFKRWALKVVLLSVFGSMMNEYTDFYDPQKGLLVTITGQLFIVDLLEKLEGLIKVIQSNTDGIIVEPYNWDDKDKIVSIVEEWEKRTGFVIKKEMIYDIWQRDVNCYFYRDDKGRIVTKGEAVNNYDRWQYLFESGVFNSKEPPIIAQGIVDYYLYNKLPETVIDEHQNQLRMFQYICKPLSYDYLDYEKIYSDNHIDVEHLQHINRAFALKPCEYIGMIYKKKNDTSAKVTRAKVANLPDSVFVYNNEILSDKAVNTVKQSIDYNYYTNRIYERIREFKQIKEIKGIC